MILVTGGNGMLGGAIVEQLLEQGHQVRSFDLQAHTNPLVHSVVGDIRNPAEVVDACANVEGVIHTASLVDLHLGRPKRLYEINVTGVENLIAACRTNSVKKMLHMSSAEVICGAKPLLNADESTPYPHPHLTYYGVTKEAGERLVLDANDDQLATCVFRTFGIFGEKDRNFLARAIEQISSKKVSQIGLNDGITNTVYAGNVAHAFMLGLSQLAVGKSIAGQGFHITDHPPQTFREFFLDVMEPFGYGPSSITIPRLPLFGVAALLALPYKLTRAERFAYPALTRHQLLLGTCDYYLESSKAYELLGYQPRFERAEAIARTQEWLATEGLVGIH